MKGLSNEPEADAKIYDSAEHDADDHAPPHSELHGQVRDKLSEEHQVPCHNCDAALVEHIKLVVEGDLLNLVLSGIDQNYQVKGIDRN